VIYFRGLCDLGGGARLFVFKKNQPSGASVVDVLTAALPTVTSLNQQKCVCAGCIVLPNNKSLLRPNQRAYPPPPPTFLQADRKVYAEPFVITPDAILALHPPALDFSTIGTDPFYDQTSGPRPAPQKNIRR
jgi:hypothetical protein